MVLRYNFEFFVGLLIIAVILIFGEILSPAFFLLAFVPLLIKIEKGKADERELYVFYKSGNYSMGVGVLCMYFINRFSDVAINGHVIGDNWFTLSIGSILMVHGLAGLLFNRK